MFPLPLYSINQNCMRSMTASHLTCPRGRMVLVGDAVVIVDKVGGCRRLGAMLGGER